MSRALPLAVFAAGFAVVYIASFVNGWTFLRYYPLSGEFSTLDLPRTAGPAMGWYSWIAQGLLAGIALSLAAMAVPKKLAEKVWPGLASASLLLIIAYTFYFEWHWFQGVMAP